MDQQERGQILSAAVRQLTEETPEPSVEPEVETAPETSEEAPVEQEAEGEAEQEVQEERPEPRIPKRRLDDEIRKKREAEEQAAYWKGRAEAPTASQQPQVTEEEDDDDEENVLYRLDRRLQSMEQRQQQLDQSRAVEQETQKLKAEISSALTDAPLATAEDVAREMLLDSRVTAADAAQVIQDRETQREAEILRKHSIKKHQKAEATRRPKTTGIPAVASEEKAPRNRDDARRAFADVFNRLKDQGR